MKKTILLLVILSLVVPVAALAAVSMPTKPDAIEFSLGGFIKMDGMWDSSTVNKNLVSKMYRSNDGVNGVHGRLRGMATGSRFNFTIKGPKVFGALVTGFIEADWDSSGASLPASTATESIDTGTFRLRHAMFRLNWPETELMLGQYWSFFSEFFPEVAADGGGQYRGANVYRPAQVRLTQKFLGWGTAAFMIATPRQGTARDTLTTGFEDERSESPHVEGKLAFEQNVWGKAPYYGNPRGFVAQVVAAWQRSHVAPLTADVATVNRQTWGQQNYTAAQAISAPNSQYLDHWSVMGTLFIPVLTTQTANLAGTASILTQWSVGEGQAFVLGTWLTDDAFMGYKNTPYPNLNVFERRLTPSFTGFVQAQYYVTNEWFANFCWGYMRNYGIGMDRITPGGQFKVAMVDAAIVPAGNSDFTKYSNQFNGTLWYQPIKAVKFGISYVYTQDRYIQRAPSLTAAVPGAHATTNATPFGDNHRVEFCGFFFF